MEERTAIFGENVIEFRKPLKESAITRPLISQIIRWATSVGANYQEANRASSRKDFRNKIHICKKETRGTGHWLRMIKGQFPKKIKKAKFSLRKPKSLPLSSGKLFLQ